jgi:hypothetical protein
LSIGLPGPCDQARAQPYGRNPTAACIADAEQEAGTRSPSKLVSVSSHDRGLATNSKSLAPATESRESPTIFPTSGSVDSQGWKASMSAGRQLACPAQPMCWAAASTAFRSRRVGSIFTRTGIAAGSSNAGAGKYFWFFTKCPKSSTPTTRCARTTAQTMCCGERPVRSSPPFLGTYSWYLGITLIVALNRAVAPLATREANRMCCICVCGQLPLLGNPSQI